MKLDFPELLATVVAAVWAVSFLADIVLTAWNPDPGVHLVMTMVVGGIFGRRFVKKDNGNGGSHGP